MTHQHCSCCSHVHGILSTPR